MIKGTPELIATRREEIINACQRLYQTMSFKEITLKEIGEAGGDRFYWNPEEHTITWFHRLSGESHIEVYALKDGELETITTADSYGPHHYPEKDNPDPLFFQDGEEISAGEIEALWDAYANDADEISYSK